MTKVSLVVLGTVRDHLGWDQSARWFEVADDKATVAGVLESIPTGTDSTLLDFLAEDGEMRPEYMIRLNGG